MSHAWVSGSPGPRRPRPALAPPRPRRSGSFSSRHGGGPRRRRRRSPRATHAADAVRKRAGLGRGECPRGVAQAGRLSGLLVSVRLWRHEPSPTLDRSPGHRRPCQLQTPWSLGSSKPPGNTLPTDAFTRHEHHGLSGAPRCAWVCSPRPRLRPATPPPLPPPKAHGRDIGTAPAPGVCCASPSAEIRCRAPGHGPPMVGQHGRRQRGSCAGPGRATATSSPASQWLHATMSLACPQEPCWWCGRLIGHPHAPHVPRQRGPCRPEAPMSGNAPLRA